MDELIIDVFLAPFTGAESYIYYYYIVIQIIVLSITYFLRKIGILTFGSPLVYYLLALIIGHVVYVVTFVYLIAHIDLIICLR